MLQFMVSILIYISAVLLQFVFAKYISFGGIYPNFILMIIVYTALNKGSLKGEIAGFIYGFTWDILSTDIFGIRALTFTIIGYLTGRFNKKLNKEQPLTQILFVFIALVIAHAGLSITYLVIPTEAKFIPFEFTSFMWLGIIYNLIIAPFVFKGLFALKKISIT